MSPAWSPSQDRPLAGVRVLSMEQAVALPYATRHLADLGADVIRVQSHKRGGAAAGFDIDLTRNKRQLALDLTGPDGPATFLRVAAACDVVAHNFTPRVVRHFGIDYGDVRGVNPDVIYLSLTGFGTTGPWRDRPLYGPGAEAFSGHNQLIGDPAAGPGRPGLNNYVDNVTGLNAAFAVLAALDERDRSGRASTSTSPSTRPRSASSAPRSPAAPTARSCPGGSLTATLRQAQGNARPTPSTASSPPPATTARSRSP